MTLGIHGRAINLVLVDVDARDMASCKGRDFSGRPSHATAHIKNFHLFFNTNLTGKIVFVPSDGTSKGFAIGESTKVKRLSPGIFVKVSRQVVVSNQFQLANYKKKKMVCKLFELTVV